MTIPTTDNITKSHTFTAQNWLRNARHVMCLLLVLPLIACGGDATDAVDQSFVDYLKIDISKAAGKGDHLGLDLDAPSTLHDITGLVIEAGSAKTIKITVKEVVKDYRDDATKEDRTGLVETLSYADPNTDGRFELKKGTDEWGQGLFGSNSDGSTVRGLVSKEQLYQNNRSLDYVLVVTGKEYVWDDVAIQSGLYTFGGKALTTAVGYERIGSAEGQNSNDVWFAMILDIPTTEQAKTKSLPADADAVLSITNWYLNDDVNAEDKNVLPLPALVSLKGGVVSNNLRLVKGDGANYIDERFLNFGTVRDISDRLGGIRKGLPFDTTAAETNFYKEVAYSSITARLYGEPGGLANKKAVIAGTYNISIRKSSNIVLTNWGVYILKQK